MKRKGYDSYTEIPKLLAELREAIAATESIAPQSRAKWRSSLKLRIN
jgi:hypothetical protein